VCSTNQRINDDSCIMILVHGEDSARTGPDSGKTNEFERSNMENSVLGHRKHPPGRLKVSLLGGSLIKKPEYSKRTPPEETPPKLINFGGGFKASNYMFGPLPKGYYNRELNQTPTHPPPGGARATPSAQCGPICTRTPSRPRRPLPLALKTPVA